MNNNEIAVIEKAAEFFSDFGHVFTDNHLHGVRKASDEHVLALRGLIDSSKAEALPVACANASGPKSAPRVKELEYAAKSALRAMDDLFGDSEGVYGLHLNDDPAPWNSLTEGGHFEEWLLPLERLREALSALEEEL